ncbi:peptidylprolyl isomerase [Effusibacillus lacus]|uniref:Foldase protein PrsA n=1 Tax=Effusibacillus lacus TaxID=1348429 RepID=A0A292YE62_9BACL|nr:peptidylprolyl isomerase [Effusibacillus lacus]TCS76788.1 foldase protein PrsA [Effusibacillus lacus]GAX91122.1 foldase [Effusibacillus lacus]
MKQWWYTVGGAAVGAALVGAIWFFRADGTVLATVGDQKITQQQLQTELEKLGGSRVLLQLINEQVVEQAAKKNKIVVSDQEIEPELARLKKQFPSEEQFKQSLEMDGITVDQLKDQIRSHILLVKLASKDVQITEEDLKKHYEEHGKEYGEQEKVKARHILVDTEEEAKAIRDRLIKGEDFAKLAKEKSKDRVSAEKGGDLGYFEQGVMAPEFDKAAFTSKVGDLSEPVKTQFGYHIIQVVEKKEAKIPAFEEVRFQMELGVRKEKGIPAEQLLPELHKQVDIKISSDQYKDVLNQPLLPIQ